MPALLDTPPALPATPMPRREPELIVRRCLSLIVTVDCSQTRSSTPTATAEAKALVVCQGCFVSVGEASSFLARREEGAYRA